MGRHTQHMDYVSRVREAVGHVRPWGVELARRAEKATSPGDFQAAAFRRIQQHRELGLDAGATDAIWRCIYFALMEEIPIDTNGQPALNKEWLDVIRGRFYPEEWKHIVAGALTELELGFPFKRYFMDPDIMFAALQAYDPLTGLRLIVFDLVAPPIQFRTIEFNCLACHESAPDDYATMDSLADCFTEGARLAARYHTRPSVIQSWAQEKAARHLTYVDALGHPEPDGSLGAHTVREAVFRSREFKECTQFKPTLAKFVYERTKATRVLDFSAGWGDRLLGALATPAIKKYHGYDPNPALVEGHTAILDRWGRRNFKVVCEPAEQAKFSGKFDLVFSSPPFFDVETYTDAPGQSTQGRHSLNAWLVEFLFPVLSKAWAALDAGGHMVLHLNDGKGLQMCEPTVIYCITHLPGCKFRGVLGTKGSQSGAVRPMWWFAKIKSPPLTDEIMFRIRCPKLSLRMKEVTITDLGPDDRPEIARILRHPDVMRWIANGKTWDETRIDEFFRRVESEGNAGAHRHWAVRSEGVVCGMTRVRPVAYTDDISPRLTVMIDPIFQKSGIGARAARLTAEIAGEPLKAEVHPDNQASVWMLTKAGFEPCEPVKIYGVEHLSFSYSR